MHVPEEDSDLTCRSSHFTSGAKRQKNRHLAIPVAVFFCQGCKAPPSPTLIHHSIASMVRLLVTGCLPEASPEIATPACSL
jgi:hypothetical protein